MTKAQAKRALDAIDKMEASKKLDAVMMSRHTALLSSAQRSKIYRLSGEVARLTKMYE